MIAIKPVGLFFLFVLAPAAAQAGASNGSNALALAAIVGELSPQTSAPNKKLLAAFFSGKADAPHAKDLRIAVKADAIDCRAGNVDITSRACELTFGAKKIELRGPQGARTLCDLDREWRRAGRRRRRLACVAHRARLHRRRR